MADFITPIQQIIAGNHPVRPAHLLFVDADAFHVAFHFRFGGKNIRLPAQEIYDACSVVKNGF